MYSLFESMTITISWDTRFSPNRINIVHEMETTENKITKYSRTWILQICGVYSDLSRHPQTHHKPRRISSRIVSPHTFLGPLWPDLALNWLKTLLKLTLKQNSHYNTNSFPMDCSILICEHAYISLSQRQKSESQDKSWSSLADSEQGAVFVGTVTEAEAHVLLHMCPASFVSCFHCGGMKSNWRCFLKQLLPVYCQLQVFSFCQWEMYSCSQMFVQYNESKHKWVLFYGGHRPEYAFQRLLKRKRSRPSALQV